MNFRFLIGFFVSVHITRADNVDTKLLIWDTPPLEAIHKVAGLEDLTLLSSESQTTFTKENSIQEDAQKKYIGRSYTDKNGIFKIYTEEFYIRGNVVQQEHVNCIALDMKKIKGSKSVRDDLLNSKILSFLDEHGIDFSSDFNPKVKWRMESEFAYGVKGEESYLLKVYVNPGRGKLILKYKDEKLFTCFIMSQFCTVRVTEDWGKASHLR